ncbi:hypothetical protein ACFVY1_43860 [Streptomyces sp. NPDC058293]|uniref:hypothetical protein n=1 Tax=Streptomyces sp. NPDC058293 TaxID=3346429 RepID=UPI0036EAEA0F
MPAPFGSWQGTGEGGGCDDMRAKPATGGIGDSLDAAGFVVVAVVEQQLVVGAFGGFG